MPTSKPPSARALADSCPIPESEPVTIATGLMPAPCGALPPDGSCSCPPLSWLTPQPYHCRGFQPTGLAQLGPQPHVPACAQAYRGCKKTANEGGEQDGRADEPEST